MKDPNKMNEDRMRLLSPSYLREVLREYGVKPRSSLGQNFLIDPNVLKIIGKSAGLKSDDIVIEVGAGAGALTQVLAKKCARVIAIEVDPGLSNFLKTEFGREKNVNIIRGDALKISPAKLFAEIPERAKMVSNLPYGIAATLVLSWLRDHPWITEYTIMVQREVAQRFIAKPRSKDYSQATVKINYYSKVEKIASVSSNCFFPKPRVETAILRLQRYDFGIRRTRLAPKAKDEKLFDLVVSAGFQQRRKKFANSLSAHPKINIEQKRIRDALLEICGNEDARAEDLSVLEFVKLSNLLCERDDPLRRRTKPETRNYARVSPGKRKNQIEQND